MLSESDLDSILSLDWVTPFESQTNTATLQQGDGTLNLGIVSETATAGTSHQTVFDAGTPHHGTVAESNLHLETTVVGTSHETVFDAGTLCHGTVTAYIAGTPHRETAVAGPSHHETATAEPSPCETAVAGPSHQRLFDTLHHEATVPGTLHRTKTLRHGARPLKRRVKQVLLDPTPVITRRRMLLDLAGLLQ